MQDGAVDRSRVAHASLRRAFDAAMPMIDHSGQLECGSAYLGQERAVDALRFEVRIDRDGYNVHVLGPHGGDRHGLARELAGERARGESAPDDWCYVHNFSDPECPRALSFPAGQGSVFHDDMQVLIREMQLAIPTAFEGDDYRNQLKAVEAETRKSVEKRVRIESPGEIYGFVSTTTLAVPSLSRATAASRAIARPSRSTARSFRRCPACQFDKTSPSPAP